MTFFFKCLYQSDKSFYYQLSIENSVVSKLWIKSIFIVSYIHSELHEDKFSRRNKIARGDKLHKENYTPRVFCMRVNKKIRKK